MITDNIPRHDMAKIREALHLLRESTDYSVRGGHKEIREYATQLGGRVSDAIDELELLRRNEQLAANFAARADEVRRAAQTVVRAKAGPDTLAFKLAVSTLLTAVLGPEVWRDGEIARDGTHGLTMEEETKP